MISVPRELIDAYDEHKFKRDAENIIHLLFNYLNEVKNGSVSHVLPPVKPEEMMSKWNSDFSVPVQEKDEMIINILKLSQHIHHPKYVGHQVTPPLPITAVDSMLTSLLNNSSAVYEMSPVDTILQKRIIEWMCKKIGYQSGDGVLTNGGTIGNLTALLAAREILGKNIWQEGICGQKLCILSSELSHYSIERAAGVMGLGTNAVIKLPVNEESRIDTSSLPEIYDSVVKQGYKVLALVANAASTPTGCYDDFNSIADFCEDKNIWFHVDGAHGASALVSEKYKFLLNGINRADSIVWDLHKMMLMPALVTGVLFKDAKNSYRAFLQEASYLFKENPEAEWFNYAHRTLECTKNMMGTKPYMCLKYFGEHFFEKYINYVYDLTRAFAEEILHSNDFHLGVMPDSNIICFRYDDGIRNSDDLQIMIREEILRTGKFYLVQTKLFNRIFLRCTIINPLTKEEDLEDLLTMIREIVNNKFFNN